MTKNLRLLWVDDDATSLLRPLGLFFEREGWLVSAAADISTAEHLLRSEPFDVVLLDLVFDDPASWRSGGLGGLELAEKLQNKELGPKNADVPTLFLSVVPRDEIAEKTGERWTAHYHFDKAALLDQDMIKQLLAALKQAALARTKEGDEVER
ncbi:MAG: hypothetical protein AABO57_03530 [Acidobacteriota bacterium]